MKFKERIREIYAHYENQEITSETAMADIEDELKKLEEED